MRSCLILISILFSWSCSTLHKQQNYTQKAEKIQIEQSEFDYLFTEALKQKALGNYNDTKVLLLKCLVLKPKSAVINYELSIVYSALGDKFNAINFAKKAVEFDKRNEWYLLQCAKLYQDESKHDSLLYFFRRIVNLRPDKFEYSFKLSQLYYGLKDFKYSLNVLNKLESRTGISLDIFLAKYKNYLALNDNKNCLIVLNEALRRFPDETRIYGLLGEHYAAIGNRDMALKNFTQLLHIDADNERGYLALIDFYRNSGQMKESFELSGKFIGNDAFSSTHKIELISSYLNDNIGFGSNKDEIKMLIDSFVFKNAEDLQGNTILANFYLKGNDLKRARVELQYLLTKSRSNIIIWEQLLFVLSSMNDFKAIFDLSNDGISNFEDNALFYLYRGISAFQLKRYNDAIFSLNRGLKTSIGTQQMLSKFYYYLAESYNAVKDNANADFYFEKCLQIDPNNVIVLNNFSYYLSLRNVKLDSALIYMDRCIKMEAKNSTFLDTYAWVLFKIGRKNDAKTVMEHALNYGGLKNTNILEHYCEILIDLNLRDIAIDYYKKIIDLGKESPVIKDKLYFSN